MHNKCLIMLLSTICHLLSDLPLIVDYESVKSIICSRPFQGKMISVQRVQVTNCIQVHSIGTLTQDSLELYFESRKNGGGDLKILKFIEGNHAIIEFAERDGEYISFLLSC